MKVINRIKDKNEFVNTVRKGKTLKETPYIIHYLENELSVCRVGLSVSKRIGNAVRRNRIKRQTRAMCDSLIDYSSHTFDVVIVIKQEFINSDFENNKKILNDLLSKIGITK
ncbi:MAG: ribonuclease P protein component [Bacilli bacterium]|nr:ribonuclease P protein component [Bacilli bacterium]